MFANPGRDRWIEQQQLKEQYERQRTEVEPLKLLQGGKQTRQMWQIRTTPALHEAMASLLEANGFEVQRWDDVTLQVWMPALVAHNG
jgi:hypothetical protein